MPTSMARSQLVKEVRDAGRASVIIVGGGINGIGTFRELALQGVDVLLVERRDFVSGASAASSHMVHGGVRYLENGELRLVKESVQERNRLLRLAPHRVKPLKTTIPIYTTFSGIVSAPLRLVTHRAGKPRERGALLIKVGLLIYDLFSRDGGTVPRHRFLGRKKSLAELPDLDPRIRYTATYFDAGMSDPERLALDVLHDGLTAGPHAKALNYVEAVGSVPNGLRLRDVETGESFDIQADLVINTTGPWTDLTNVALGMPSSFMGGTKGSHIVLHDDELLRATGGREIFFENEDGRIVLIYPMHDRVLVGTTDIDADPEQPIAITDEEIDYFIHLVARVFPTIPVRRERIVHTFAGIRPLPRHGDSAPGVVSRDYRIESEVPAALGIPLLSLVGGKWTTFRAVAEHLADIVLERIGARREHSTRDLILQNAIGLPDEDGTDAWLQQHLPGVDLERARVLLARYGTRCVELAPYLGGDDAPLAGTALSTGEVRYMVEHENVLRLCDVVMRRTNLAFRGNAGADVLDAVADCLADLLGWNAARKRAEVDEVATIQAIGIAAASVDHR